MRNNQVLIISILFVLQACIVHFEPLKYYVQGYKPDNSNFSTKGFYYKKSDSLVHKEWPSAIEEMYFFKDGTFEFGSNTEHLDSLNIWICKFKEQNFKYGPFGFYTIKNDTIFVEYIVKDLPGFTRAERLEFKAIKTQKGIKVVEENGEKVNQEWFFHKNDCVPDSINNWLKKHRKYRLRSNYQY